MALSTTDLGTAGSGLPKTITPGNHVLKINSIELEEFKFIPGAYHLMLHVETAPIEGFEGFLIDKDDESKGHYAGQIGRVKASQYAFADGETKSGIKIQQLSDDHKPGNPKESERIKQAGGRIETFKGPNGECLGPGRVWLQNEDSPGLAMSRSLGDYQAHSIGVIPDPDIDRYELT